VRCGTSDGQAYLEVEDNGPGIVPALREQVFERFYRLPGSAPGGSGLGLAIVQEIVGLYRGKVEILDPGQGPGVRVRASFAQHALPLQAAQPATGRA
jgi:two-component system sensor histidine kinase TctE